MMNQIPEIKDIDSVLLTSLVRQALDSPTAEISHWEHHPISYIKSEESNLGLHRFKGTAQVQGEARPWSLVLKAVHAPFNDSDPTHWNYHRREILAYREGLLVDLPGGLRAPRCFGVTEHPEGLCWLWLEDIQDSANVSWSLAQYSIAARYLGRFNGAYLAGHPLPDQPWLSQNWMRGWLNHYDGDCQDTLKLIRDEGFWEHPLLKSSFPRPATDNLLKLWTSHEQLLSILDRLPKTFCHMDAYRPNLLICRNAEGLEQTVAIDWVFVGLGGLGEEIANLLAASLIWFEYDASNANGLDQVVFDGYMIGLREAGWRGDSQLVRLGYTTACALRWGVVGLWWLNSLTETHPNKQAGFEQHWNRPMPQLVLQWAQTTNYVLHLAEEAYQLQRALF